MREDYSADGDGWNYLPHDHARSRAYRWGEDGLLGICDRECRLCFAIALWNERDPILKERLFGLTGPEGNHGEDVKEQYFYLDSTPTHSYMKGLYKYPQAEFPYNNLVEENAHRTRNDPEYEILDTGVFDDNRYFDVFVEYAKNTPDDTLIRITVCNRASEPATIHLLPTLWARNSWIWGCLHEGCEPKPRMGKSGPNSADIDQATLGKFRWVAQQQAAHQQGDQPEMLFTENETNNQRIFNSPNLRKYVKDAFHRYIINGEKDAVNPAGLGTKIAAALRSSKFPRRAANPSSACAFSPRIKRPPTRSMRTSIASSKSESPRPTNFTPLATLSKTLSPDVQNTGRQCFAGLLWSKQFYHYIVEDWLEGDPDQPTPPDSRWNGRNREWRHVYSRDVLSMPDNWEYPWYAAWDLAFHTITFATIDPEFAKEQLVLMLREWYMHPNGQLPAYEFEFSDVNPPVHAYTCWRVYKMTAPRGGRDRMFLERAFQKLLINFTWWVNRKDINGRNIFGGGFLGLDNIGVFDRSKPLPTGGTLEQADGTAWMAFYCSTMLAMALELAREDSVYEDIASKFFEHYVSIVNAINTLGGSGLWDEQDGFYYDQLYLDNHAIPLRVRSMVGMIPLFAVEVLEEDIVHPLKGFKKRMDWFLQNSKHFSRHVTYTPPTEHHCGHYLLAIPSPKTFARAGICFK